MTLKYDNDARIVTKYTNASIEKISCEVATLFGIDIWESCKPENGERLAHWISRASDIVEAQGEDAYTINDAVELIDFIKRRRPTGGLHSVPCDVFDAFCSLIWEDGGEDACPVCGFPMGKHYDGDEVCCDQCGSDFVVRCEDEGYIGGDGTNCYGGRVGQNFRTINYTNQIINL